MKKIVQDTLDRIYRKFDHEFYLQRSCQPLTLPGSVDEFVKGSNISVVEFYKSKTCWPSKKWDFHVSKVDRGEFKSEFKTVLLVSKLAPLIHLQHEFRVKNQAEDQIHPLYGFFEQPFTQTQFRLDELMSGTYSALGYTRLSYAEMNEVVCDLAFPEGVTIYGPQVTVQYALFNDFLGLAGD